MSLRISSFFILCALLNTLILRGQKVKPKARQYFKSALVAKALEQSDSVIYYLHAKLEVADAGSLQPTKNPYPRSV